MATVSIDAPARLSVHRPCRVAPRVSDCRLRTTSTVDAWGTGPRDQLVVVDAKNQQQLAELRSAVIDRPQWALNGVASMRFRISADDPTLLDCMVDPDTFDNGTGELRLIGYVEAQFWRDGEIRWAGPIVVADPDLSSGVVEFECWDLGWYITRRFMGNAERKDLLNDIGQFNTYGLPGWTRDGVTAVRNTSVKVRGAGSAQISGTGAISASFRHPVQTVGQDLTVLLSFMVRVPEGTPEGTALATIRAIPDGSAEPYRFSAENTASTTTDTPLGQWERVTCRTMMKPGVQNTIQISLWSYGYGNTYIDDCRALRNDTTGIPAPGGDLTEHAAATVNHMQRKLPTGEYAGYNFKVAVRSVSGTVEVLGLRHLLHEQIIDVFDRYVNRSDGWDWWIDPRTRTINFAARRGQDHTEIALSDRTVLTGGWSHDESDKSSAIVVLGEGDGADRPEGGYVDTSRTGGLVLEYLEPSRNDRPLSALDATAKSLWEQKSQPQTTLKPIVVPASWWTEYGVGPGDRFPNHLRCGVLRPSTLGDGFRVQTMTHDLVSDTLELV